MNNKEQIKDWEIVNSAFRSMVLQNLVSIEMEEKITIDEAIKTTGRFEMINAFIKSQKPLKLVEKSKYRVKKFIYCLRQDSLIYDSNKTRIDWDSLQENDVIVFEGEYINNNDVLEFSIKGHSNCLYHITKDQFHPYFFEMIKDD